MLGSVSHPPAPKPKKIRFRPSGAAANPPIHTKGQRVSLFEDLYHRVLAMPWWQFLSYATAAWFGINGVFALLYAADAGLRLGRTRRRPRGRVLLQRPDARDHRLRSDGASHSLRARHRRLRGARGNARRGLGDGSHFAKFARPTARVLFGSKAVVHVRDGVPHLVFRLANWRGNMVVEGQLRLLVLADSADPRGGRDSLARWSYRSCAIAPRSSRSPGCRCTASTRRARFGVGRRARERLRGIKREIFLAFTGLDETIGAIDPRAPSLQARRHRL